MKMLYKRNVKFLTKLKNPSENIVGPMQAVR